MDLKEFRKSFDPAFEKYLKTRVSGVRKILGDKALGNIVRAGERLALSGGKRARPFMVAAMYEAFGGKDKRMIMDVAVGMELFHLFCLVHDDVIDRGALRHDVPTVHVFTEKLLRKGKRRGDLLHIADGQAVLVGDFLFAWATNSVLRHLSKGEKRASQIFFEMIDEVISGQMIDVDLMTQRRPERKAMRRKMILKTATYTFIRPLELGLALANGQEKFEKVLEKFGKEIGYAFQLQDDLLDVLADPKITGKPRMSDVRDGVHTPLTLHVFANATKTDQKMFAALFGKKNLTRSEEKIIITIFERSGAIAATQKEVDNGFKKSRRIVEVSDLPVKAKSVLLDLVSYIESRRS